MLRHSTALGGLLLVCAVALTGCEHKSSGAAAKPPAAATVPNPPKEDQLNTFSLTPAAETLVGISTTAIEKRPITRMRMYAGEVVLPTGGSIVVSAPLAGFLQNPKSGPLTALGEVVRKGQTIYELVPGISEKEQSVLSPVDRLNLEMARANLAQSRNDAEAGVEQADEQLRAAKIELERAQKLYDKDAGTLQNLDRAKAAFNLAQKVHEAAIRRKKIWDKVQLDEKTGAFKPLSIEAPQDGIIRTLHALAGEGVAPGALLFEVLNTSVFWVKVPVYAGEVSEIDTTKAARLSSLEDRTGRTSLSAEPVSAPPTAQPLSSSVDLYFTVENKDGQLRPGQKVNASVPLRDERESLVIPWSALVTDINGGTWVYESLGEQKYSRRRVAVRYVIGSDAVLASGPPVGAKIVTEGAAELFGTEFFVTK
jgi:RND family efflux transporter MFP subunit